jgi:glutathione S-transferase
MPYVVIVTILALIQVTYFGLMVGRARGKYGVHAPAMSGHEVFDRTFRVHLNTIEQLVMILPLMWIFAHFVSPLYAAGFGVVYLIGRAIYSITYVKDPKSRSLGFLLTVLPSFAMMIWLLIWAIGAIAKGAAR